MSQLVIPVKKYLAIFFERFGYTTEMYELASHVSRQFSHVSVRLQNLCQGPLEEIKKQIDAAREA